jgi:FAD/FMN-containing dehydrogenase
MAGVEIDAGSRTARVEAGALWGDVGRRAAEHGLVGLHGSAAEVGVVGYTLGGGHGWLGRLHGLAANSVLSLDVVTADGRRVRAAHDSEPELFWALRGGGGSFGVVTAMEFSLYPLSEAYAGMIAWPADRGAEVFSLYREWTGGFPEEMSAWARFLTLPPLPEVPEPLRARPVVDITAAYAGPEEEGAELLKPLRELGDPVVDTFGAIPGAGLSAINGDPEEPVPGIGDGDLLRELSPDAVAALVEVAGADSGSPLLMVQLRQLGGALARASDDGGATSKLDADFAMYSVGVAMGPDVSRAVEAHVKRVREELRPWTAPTRYLNFVDAPAAAAQSFDPETFSRLQRVKAQYDPSGTFRANHEVDAAV